MTPESPVKLWTGPSDRRAPCGPCGRPVDNAVALPTARPHSRASRPRTSQDPQQVISGRERRGLPPRLTSPGRGGRFVRRGHFIQPEYTLFPPSNCPTNQDHLPWHEIAKGRIINVDVSTGIASGEIYTGGRKADLERALTILSVEDLLEVDQYGAAAKVLSGLAEHSLVGQLVETGYIVKRMPEDMAKHLGSYPNYDFEVSKDNQTRKLEVKSLWGTNTQYARLIHSRTSKPPGTPADWTGTQRRNYYPTSSCKFSTQDIFAVSLFLRTGNIRDFAFARSVPIDIQPHGLPRASNFREHVNQNPSCTIGDGSWFETIDDVWDLV